jgi:hypothetical protein
MSVQTLCLLRLRGHSKQAGDERDLSSAVTLFHSFHLAFPNHVHHLVSLEGSPRGLKGEKAQSWHDQSLDEPVILLHQVVEILHLAERTLGWNAALFLQLRQRFGIRGVFVNGDHAGVTV